MKESANSVHCGSRTLASAGKLNYSRGAFASLDELQKQCNKTAW